MILIKSFVEACWKALKRADMKLIMSNFDVDYEVCNKLSIRSFRSALYKLFTKSLQSFILAPLQSFLLGPYKASYYTSNADICSPTHRVSKTFEEFTQIPLASRNN